MIRIALIAAALAASGCASLQAGLNRLNDPVVQARLACSSSYFSGRPCYVNQSGQAVQLQGPAAPRTAVICHETLAGVQCTGGEPIGSPPGPAVICRETMSGFICH